jgi:hypothetical protein
MKFRLYRLENLDNKTGKDVCWPDLHIDLLDTKMIWYLINTGQFGYSQPEETYLEDTYDLTA